MRIPTLLVVVLLALAGCGGGTTTVQAAPAADTLAFSGRTLDDTMFDGTTLAGKPAVLWFWAPWCSACRSQSTDVRKAAARYQGRVGMVGIAGMDKEPPMHDFVTTMNVGQVPHVADPGGAIWKRFGITQQSTYVLLDQTGHEIDRGVWDGEQLDERLAKLAP